MNKGMDYCMSKFLLYSSFFTAYKGEMYEEKLIAYDRFDMM